jgi:hypothetical protein
MPHQDNNKPAWADSKMTRGEVRTLAAMMVGCEPEELQDLAITVHIHRYPDVCELNRYGDSPPETWRCNL